MNISTRMILFLNTLLLIFLYHFVPMMVLHMKKEHEKSIMKTKFNAMLENGNESIEKLRMLKALINNVNYCKRTYVPMDGDIEEVRDTYNRMDIGGGEVFLRLCLKYNLSIFFPVFFPMLVHCIGVVKHKHQ
ncbi:hypothetical protein CWI42_050890 [Ordospora colligata]|uniref:Uncharacterized protein n=1 Tax=Ordospora colligata OC4 TaxID=1354746 RepID=A0A0B2UL27_9MICR|nr:uncharacterized protein M896_050920 [Ordospora colligata OC4]KHN69685.1 hypothetical protein M896_050920 [Ordospora colligata OC4]TBU15804.1 hypothetical protein CWI41_050910 [Ordospora colligata]TBU15932.1 hypothetical protein CWI40_050930 [Ordospora colligata]TBU18826.1 hypothetical protein CWI42_050890 [Ordospora colligata]